MLSRAAIFRRAPLRWRAVAAASQLLLARPLCSTDAPPRRTRAAADNWPHLHLALAASAAAIAAVVASQASAHSDADEDEPAYAYDALVPHERAAPLLKELLEPTRREFGLPGGGAVSEAFPASGYAKGPREPLRRPGDIPAPFVQLRSTPDGGQSVALGIWCGPGDTYAHAGDGGTIPGASVVGGEASAFGVGRSGAPASTYASAVRAVDLQRVEAVCALLAAHYPCEMAAARAWLADQVAGAAGSHRKQTQQATTAAQLPAVPPPAATAAVPPVTASATGSDIDAFMPWQSLLDVAAASNADSTMDTCPRVRVTHESSDDLHGTVSRVTVPLGSDGRVLRVSVSRTPIMMIEWASAPPQHRRGDSTSSGGGSGGGGVTTRDLTALAYMYTAIAQGNALYSASMAHAATLFSPPWLAAAAAALPALAADPAGAATSEAVRSIIPSLFGGPYDPTAIAGAVRGCLAAYVPYLPLAGQQPQAGAGVAPAVVGTAGGDWAWLGRVGSLLAGDAAARQLRAPGGIIVGDTAGVMPAFECARASHVELAACNAVLAKLHRQQQLQASAASVPAAEWPGVPIPPANLSWKVLLASALSAAFAGGSPATASDALAPASGGVESSTGSGAASVSEPAGDPISRALLGAASSLAKSVVGWLGDGKPVGSSGGSVGGALADWNRGVLVATQRQQALAARLLPAAQLGGSGGKATKQDDSTRQLLASLLAETSLLPPSAAAALLHQWSAPSGASPPSGVPDATGAALPSLARAIVWMRCLFAQEGIGRRTGAADASASPHLLSLTADYSASTGTPGDLDKGVASGGRRPAVDRPTTRGGGSRFDKPPVVGPAAGGTTGRPPPLTREQADLQAALKVFDKHGVKYYGVQSPTSSSTTHTGGNELSWSDLAGYEAIKQQVEDFVLFPMQHPDVFAAVGAKTRARPQLNTAGAYVFTGPPGTGKTTTARIIASMTSRPLVVLNFEEIGSMYFSGSEHNFAEILAAVRKIPGAILFIDEADAMFPGRAGLSGGGGDGDSTTDSVTHAKLQAQMLKFMEGMEGPANTVVIFATNRPTRLDAALLSRCASAVRFALPDDRQRAAIWARYAQHLPGDQLEALAKSSEGFSGRDVKRVCEVVERRHASMLVRQREAGAATGSGGGPAASSPTEAPTAASDDLPLPALADYQAAVEEREEGLLSLLERAARGSRGRHHRDGSRGPRAGPTTGGPFGSSHGEQQQARMA